jgi:hypothetical protein
VIAAAFGSRWKMLHNDLHSAAFVLDPEFHEHSAASEEDVQEGLENVLERLLPPDEAANAFIEYGAYRLKEGVWSRPALWAAAKGMSAHTWWDLRKGKAPALAKVAMRLLSQVSSACACERNWSTYDFIHNKLRNRLDPARAEKLVFVHSNLRLLRERTAVDYEQAFHPWAESESNSSDEEVSDSSKSRSSGAASSKSRSKGSESDNPSEESSDADSGDVQGGGIAQQQQPLRTGSGRVSRPSLRVQQMEQPPAPTQGRKRHGAANNRQRAAKAARRGGRAGGSDAAEA